jgi:hypothetical protein
MPAAPGLPWPGAPVGAMAELSQLLLRLVAVVPRAAGVELCGGSLKFRHRVLGLAGSGERAAGRYL